MRTPLKVGLVCPYSLDVPGGVQLHVREFAEYLLRAGHNVDVLAPADDDTPVPDYVTSTGRALAVPYNGSVARLAFGPVASARVRRWLDEGDFDVVHLHEPQIPSLSLIALVAVDRQPVVATFHTSITRSRALQAVFPLLRPALEKIEARIAVSEDARRTVTDHLGGDAVVIPNGVDASRFLAARPQAILPEQTKPTVPGGRPARADTMLFLGRTDEPRKGLSVLTEAMPRILAERPGTRLIVAGRGDVAAAQAGFAAVGLPEGVVQVLGEVSEADKVGLLASTDLYIAPQTGGESFGIVLVEAMAAGAPVLASDLPAFVRVLDSGACGALFRTGDPRALADGALALLADPARRGTLRELGRNRARRYDWSSVAEQILTMYDLVLAGDSRPVL